MVKAVCIDNIYEKVVCVDDIYEKVVCVDDKSGITMVFLWFYTQTYVELNVKLYLIFFLAFFYHKIWNITGHTILQTLFQIYWEDKCE